MKPDIVRFFRDKRFLNFPLSVGQAASLKVLYGQELDPAEWQAMKRHLRIKYRRHEFREGVFVEGRRAGKSRRAAGLAIYEGIFGGHEKCLAPGETAVIPVISASKRQTQVVKNYALRMMKDSPALRPHIVNDTSEQIELANGISIMCLPCSSKNIRSFAFPAAVLDEVGFWRYEGYADADKDVLSAVRPAMIQFRRPKLLMISTPWIRAGELWRYYNQPRKEMMIWQSPTWEMNPLISRADLDDEFIEDPVGSNREYGALFTSAISAIFSPDHVERAMERGYTQLKPAYGARYFGAIDPAFTSDSFALVIGHIEYGRVIIDHVVEWKPPVDLEVVTGELAKFCQLYGIRKLWSDQYAAEPLKQVFRRGGVNIETVVFTSQFKTAAYNTLRHLLSGNDIVLPAIHELKAQLLSCEEKRMPGGLVKLGAPGGLHDDIVDALTLLCHKLTPAAARRPRRPVRMAEALRGKGSRVSGGQYWTQKFRALENNPGGHLSIQDIKRLSGNGSPQ